MATKTKAETEEQATEETTAAPSSGEHGWEPTDYHRLAAEHGCVGDITE